MTSNNIWKPLGGKSRNFINTETGEILSRRQYEQKILGRGPSFFQKKAAANKAANPELAAARPARKRKSTVAKLVTGLSNEELKEQLEAYRIKTAIDKKRYATWNTKKNLWGFTTILVKYPRIKGVNHENQTAANAEAQTLPLVVKAIVEKIKAFKNIAGYQVQLFSTHDNQHRPVRDWEHEFQHRSSKFDVEKMRELLVEGQVDGSAAGAVTSITIRAYFETDQAKKHYAKEKPRMEAARARKIAASRKKSKAKKS
jgi:hypothetical protein